MKNFNCDYNLLSFDENRIIIFKNKITKDSMEVDKFWRPIFGGGRVSEIETVLNNRTFLSEDFVMGWRVSKNPILVNEPIHILILIISLFKKVKIISKPRCSVSFNLI